MASLRPEDVQHLRMASLLLAQDEVRSPAEIATWFGAMQAQDLASGLWSFGVRMPGSTLAEVEAAVEGGEVLRTWPMRGTVHFIPSVDARWMLAVTGVRALAAAARRREALGLSEVAADQAADLLGAALAGGTRLTRSACVELLVDAGLHTASPHGYHLLWYAAQIGVISIGPNQGKEQTFVLLDDWAPDQRSLDRDEALAELALRYFRSHGPTTRKDFAGWTGLTQGDAKRGIELAGEALATIDVAGTPLVLSADLLDRAPAVLAVHDPDQLRVLPGFDEYVLGFKDRTGFVPAAHADQIVPGNNGMFMPTIVVGGHVVGTWKRDRKTARVDLRPRWFDRPARGHAAAFERAGTEYAAYLGLEPCFPDG